MLYYGCEVVSYSSRQVICKQGRDLGSLQVISELIQFLFSTPLYLQLRRIKVACPRYFFVSATIAFVVQKRNFVKRIPFPP